MSISKTTASKGSNHIHQMELFHSSAEKIVKITNDGRLGSILSFYIEKEGAEILEDVQSLMQTYSYETAVKIHLENGGKNRLIMYKINIDEEEIIEEGQIWYQENADILEPLVEEFAKRFKIDYDIAYSVLDGGTEMSKAIGEYDYDNVLESEKYKTKAAKILGYRGVRISDYIDRDVVLVDMMGRENELIKI